MALVRLWNSAGASDSGFNAVAHIAEKKVFVAGDEDGCIHFFSDSGSKVQSMGISDDEITSICPGANETIFVSAGEIVYQVDPRNSVDPTRSFKIGREEINHISINENLTRLATADDDGRIRVADVSKPEGEPKIKAFRAKHENLATAVEWTTEQILHSASADQSIRTWRVDQQKCVKTLDVSPYKNEIREDSSETKVNVSPPLVHTISILRNSKPEFVLAGCENGSIISNKLDAGKLSSNKTLTQNFKGSHNFGIGKICNMSLNDRWLVVSGGNDNAVKFWTAEAEERTLKLRLDKSTSLSTKINGMVLASKERVIVANGQNKLSELILQ
ncbi:unnamed protein product [Oikopleura dioica]|uniref:Uncharacterized protein n=2 Tax=Oikopleura dioica TaxID=34765 RepID=E4XHR3_OIKDI|nr:unnamed protein product [Oikopleura dioica]